MSNGNGTIDLAVGNGSIPETVDATKFHPEEQANDRPVMRSDLNKIVEVLLAQNKEIANLRRQIDTSRAQNDLLSFAVEGLIRELEQRFPGKTSWRGKIESYSFDEEFSKKVKWFKEECRLGTGKFRLIELLSEDETDQSSEEEVKP